MARTATMVAKKSRGARIQRLRQAGRRPSRRARKNRADQDQRREQGGPSPGRWPQKRRSAPQPSSRATGRTRARPGRARRRPRGGARAGVSRTGGPQRAMRAGGVVQSLHTSRPASRVSGPRPGGGWTHSIRKVLGGDIVTRHRSRRASAGAYRAARPRLREPALLAQQLVAEQGGAHRPGRGRTPARRARSTAR